jgi:hypothetical protein
MDRNQGPKATITEQRSFFHTSDVSSPEQADGPATAGQPSRSVP